MMISGEHAYLAVVNYPELKQADFDWIQAIRRAHDPLYFDVVMPHLTLVFPTDQLEETIFIQHVKSIASRFSSFDIVFRCSLIGDPDFEDCAHVFLVPDEGFSRLVKFHDQLYTGPLRSELRLDLPFIPHLAIGNNPHLEYCKTIVDDLNKEHFEIKGKVDHLDIIGYDGQKVWTIQRVFLKASDMA
jgi:2'-5' RNA ligase